MVYIKKKSAFFIGLALFSMFFGSGNLTFPLFVGQISEGHWLSATLGFLISATLLPFLGILGMIFFQGNAQAFFGKCGKYIGGKFLIPIFLTIWIPLGSAPRCVAVAKASLEPVLGEIPLWIFSILYCVFIFFLVSKKQRLLDIMGYVLTPILLIGLIVLFIASLFTPETFVENHKANFFSQGLIEGYNTMDLIASCFFTSSIIQLLDSKSGDKTSAIRLFFKSSVIGVLILAAVYIGMIHMAAKYSNALEGLGKEQLLPNLIHILLGPYSTMVAAFIILIACITTSAALVLVYADYLRSWVKKGNGAAYITIFATFLFSLIGFSGIVALTSPLLQILYPLLIVMVFISIYLRRKKATLNRSLEIDS